MNKNKYQAKRWLTQAEADLRAAKANKDKFAFNSCFLSQQAGEKSLKAFLYFHGKRRIITHSNFGLINLCLKFNKNFLDLKSEAKLLDGFYLPSRYPDSLPDQIPSEFYEKEDAIKAIKAAEKILTKVKKNITK